MNHIKPSGTYLHQANINEASASRRGILNSTQRTDQKKDTPDSDIVVSLSDTSKEIQAAKQAAVSEPDVRDEKINELKALIDSKQYDIRPLDIAEKIIGLHIDETI